VRIYPLLRSMTDADLASTPDSYGPKASRGDVRSLAALNDLPSGVAGERLLEACGSRRWAQAVAAELPLDSFEDLLAAAERAFDRLAREDWLEAFAAHARIGEPRAADRRGSVEQAGVAAATPEQLAELRAGNEAYEQRFGHVFLIRAAGLDTEAMLAALHRRLANPPELELRLAAEQQRGITAGRLRQMLTS
jgi:OHCU decarboxylase